MPAAPRCLVVALLGLAGCVPYAVGTTAATVPERRVEPSGIVQIASARRDLDRDDGPSSPAVSIANEARLGLDARTDVGVRLTGFGGVTASVKRRLRGQGDTGSAIMLGAGVVGASHVHTEATLIVSRASAPVLGRTLGSRVAPYGGLRFQDLAPFAGDALNTPPAVGVFAGARLGWPDLAISPEVGVFYSPRPGEGSLLVVPSITVRGDRLRRALGL
ncbi:MAG TPA: hypothetical protein VGB53_11535 [Rubricoccaceae bacterium]|jgi:hypothetical protein